MKKPIENYMPKIDGKSFRCECGCNVFHKKKNKKGENGHIYICNSCDAWYEGIPKSLKE